ncbi:MAG: MXAN_5187 C-terminal domain-containing protein [Terriglobales bacterium]
MTIDEELNVLEENVRRLKVEYDMYFGGGAKRPPNDTEWRVQTALKKYSEGSKLTYAQRFRFNTIQQRYAKFSDLWRQKAKIKEEGYRRPQDAVLGITGMRQAEEHAAAAALEGEASNEPFKVACSDVNADPESVKALFNAMMDARKKAGQAVDPNSFESFKRFVSGKTDQIRKEYGCHSVEYSVELQDGQVKLKAKAKV